MTPQIKNRIEQIQRGEIPDGYKQTQVGIVPCEWDVQKILNVAPLQRGFDLPSQDIIDGKYPIVYSNGVKGTHHEYKAKGAGVVTGRSGTIGKVTYIEDYYWPHNTSLWVTNFYDNIPKFIFYKFQNLNFSKFDSGSGVPTLNRNDVHNERISLPTKPEQNRIAEILSTQDKVIALQEKLIQEKEEQKKYLMQILLTGKKRLKRFSGKWDKQYIKDICVLKRGGSPRPIEAYLTNDSTGLNWLKIGDISVDSKYIYKTSSKIKKEGINKTTFLNEGDFILSNSMSFGRPYILKISTCIHDGWLALTDFSPKTNKNFFYYYLSSQEMQNQFSGLAAGSGVRNLNIDLVKEIEISLPPLPEQEAIAEILSTADAEIELLKKQLEQEKLKKKSLMQLLLTGIVRV